jgi:hypothetical protein
LATVVPQLAWGVERESIAFTRTCYIDDPCVIYRQNDEARRVMCCVRPQ